MGGHMHAIGEQRHGMKGQAAADFHHHENSGYQGRQLGATFRTAMGSTQEDMVAGPGTMLMTFLGLVVAMSVFVAMPVIMLMVVIMVAMAAMGMVMGRCHDASVTRRVRKFSPIAVPLRDFHIGPIGSLPGARQTKFSASLMSPEPLYLASCG